VSQFEEVNSSFNRCVGTGKFSEVFYK